jgi:hypothetical protein
VALGVVVDDGKTVRARLRARVGGVRLRLDGLGLDGEMLDEDGGRLGIAEDGWKELGRALRSTGARCGSGSKSR